MSAISEAGTKDKTSVKALERQKKNIEERLEKAAFFSKRLIIVF